MSGKKLFTPDGTSYNIDDLDISQFTQIYLVDTPSSQMTQIKDSSIYQIAVEVKDVDVKEEEWDTGYKKAQDEAIQKEKTVNPRSHDERKNTDGAESERDEKDKKEVENTDQNSIEVCGSTNLKKKNDDDKRKSDESDHDEKYKEGIEAENEVTVSG